MDKPTYKGLKKELKDLNEQVGDINRKLGEWKETVNSLEERRIQRF